MLGRRARAQGRQIGVVGGQAGLIDVGDMGPADPALDLVAAWHLLDDAPRQALRADLPKLPATRSDHNRCSIRVHRWIVRERRLVSLSVAHSTGSAVRPKRKGLRFCNNLLFK